MRSRFDERSDISPEEAALFLKHNALKQGAAPTGVTESRENLFYAFRGRGSRYGEPVNQLLPRVLVFVLKRIRKRFVRPLSPGRVRKWFFPPPPLLQAWEKSGDTACWLQRITVPGYG